MHRWSLVVFWFELCRYMMLIDGLREVYMIDRDNTVFHIPALSFWRRKDLTAPLQHTLVDGEMIVDQVNGTPMPRYLIYDIVKFEVCFKLCLG